MKTFNFPFTIENGAIVVNDTYYDYMFEVNHLLQMWLVGYKERIYNLKQTGMLKEYLFKNMTDAMKAEVIKALKNAAAQQQDIVRVEEIYIYSKEEMKQKETNLRINDYDINTYFIEVIFTVLRNNTTINMIMSDIGKIFNLLIVE